ncbi:hypothetical protein SLA2020_484660 [Shorea laevis]
MAPTMSLWILLLGMAMSHNSGVKGADVGINYGRLGNNLPSPKRVIKFLVKDLKYAIPLIRLFDSDPEILAALGKTKLVVTLDTRNEDLPKLARSLHFTRNWLKKCVTPYMNSTGHGTRFRYLTLGNEVIPGPFAANVLPAMKNLQQAVVETKLSNYIQVSTAVHSAVLGSSNNAPLLINVYPYFAYASDPEDISLDYAMFRSKKPVVIDGNLKYYNLFDAMVDAFVAAVEKAVGREDIKIVVSETGWPSAGNEPHTTKKNAQTYNKNLNHRIKYLGGTPRRPDLNLETYIFALFNENRKPAGVEQNFGLFYPNLTQTYPLWYS